MAVLNPLVKTDVDTANDTDLAGPLVFCLLFGAVLLLVSSDGVIFSRSQTVCRPQRDSVEMHRSKLQC